MMEGSLTCMVTYGFLTNSGGKGLKELCILHHITCGYVAVDVFLMVFGTCLGRMCRFGITLDLTSGCEVNQPNSLSQPDLTCYQQTWVHRTHRLVFGVGHLAECGHDHVFEQNCQHVHLESGSCGCTSLCFPKMDVNT